VVPLGGGEGKKGREGKSTRILLSFIAFSRLGEKKKGENVFSDHMLYSEKPKGEGKGGGKRGALGSGTGDYSRLTAA